jgi:hypothetical protein
MLDSSIHPVGDFLFGPLDLRLELVADLSTRFKRGDMRLPLLCGFYFPGLAPNLRLCAC